MVADACGLEIEPATDEDPEAKARAAAKGRTAEKRVAAAQENSEEAKRQHVSKRVAYARRLVDRSEGLSGSIGERYLVKTRRVPAGVWPDSIRFHRTSNAVQFIATDDDGQVRAVQRVFLNSQAQKRECLAAGGKKSAKWTNGFLAGSACRLPGDPDGPLQIASGPETGTSAWRVTGHETWIGFGSFGHVPIPTKRRMVIFLADDDPVGSGPEQEMLTVAAAWRKAGHLLRFVFPWVERKGDRRDFNSLLKRCGPQAVRDRIEAARRRPDGRPARVTLPTGRTVVERAIGSYFEASDQWDRESGRPPPVHMIRNTVGTGKSTLNRRVATEYAERLAGKADPPTIVIATDTVELAEEMAEGLQQEPAHLRGNLRTVVLRGRTQEDPDAPDQKMCLDLERVQDAIEIGATPIQRSCCIRELEDGTEQRCPFSYDFGYQKQLTALRSAHFVVGAHDYLTYPRMDAIGLVRNLIIDEAVWQKFLWGTGSGPGEQTRISLNSFASVAKFNVDQDTAQTIGKSNDLLLRLLRNHEDGPLERSVLCDPAELPDAEQAGMEAMSNEEIVRYLRDLGEPIRLTIKIAAVMSRLMWVLRDRIILHPNMSVVERKEAVKAAAGQHNVGRSAAVWTVVAELLAPGGPEKSGRARLNTERSGDGEVRYIELCGTKELGEGWQVPTLLLDGTGDADLNRSTWPQLELTADVDVEAPHERVRVVQAAYAKSHLIFNARYPSKRHTATSTSQGAHPPARHHHPRGTCPFTRTGPAAAFLT